MSRPTGRHEPYIEGSPVPAATPAGTVVPNLIELWYRGTGFLTWRLSIFGYVLVRCISTALRPDQHVHFDRFRVELMSAVFANPKDWKIIRRWIVGFHQLPPYIASASVLPSVNPDALRCITYVAAC